MQFVFGYRILLFLLCLFVFNGDMLCSHEQTLGYITHLDVPVVAALLSRLHLLKGNAIFVFAGAAGQNLLTESGSAKRNATVISKGSISLVGDLSLKSLAANSSLCYRKPTLIFHALLYTMTLIFVAYGQILWMWHARLLRGLQRRLKPRGLK